MSDAPANGNGHKWMTSIVSGVLSIVGTFVGIFGWQIIQATWNAATIVAKMDSRIENVEHGLKGLKEETAEIKSLLMPTSAKAAQPAEPKRVIRPPGGRAQAP